MGGCRSISADGGQIQQAVIALATNGIDAMPDGGKLTFRVFSNGNRVAIEVEDTGMRHTAGEHAERSSSRSLRPKRSDRALASAWPSVTASSRNTAAV